MLTVLEQLLIDLLKSILLNQLQQATSAQVSGVSSFAQQSTNEILAGITQLYNQNVALFQKMQQVDADLSALISSGPQLNHVVTLPSTPPAGYGGLNPTQTGNAVWGFVIPETGMIAADELADCASFARNLATVSELPHPYAKYVDYHFDYTTEEFSPDTEPVPLLDPTTILPSDASIVAWLNRTDSLGFVWTLLNTQVVSFSHTVISDEWWICNISQAEFEWWQGRGVVSPSAFAPVWPGLANVTLGAPQALANGLLIPGPLDGVVIAITAVPNPIGFYPFGPIKSFVHVGGIAFVSDAGEAETVQPIGLDANVVCPKSMTQAAHAYLRLQSGVTGTVQPWLKS